MSVVRNVLFSERPARVRPQSYRIMSQPRSGEVLPEAGFPRERETNPLPRPTSRSRKLFAKQAHCTYLVLSEFQPEYGELVNTCVHQLVEIRKEVHYFAEADEETPRLDAF